MPAEEDDASHRLCKVLRQSGNGVDGPEGRVGVAIMWRRRHRFGFVLLVMATATFGLAAAGGLAGAQEATGRGITSAGGAKALLLDGKPELAKVDSHLLRARLLARDGVGPAGISAQVPMVDIVEDSVLLDITVRLDPGVLEALEAAGLDVLGAWPEHGRVSGRASLEALESIAAVPQVRVVHLEYGFTTNVGATTSQADASIDADAARAFFGVDGSGVEVGVLSDSLRTGGAGLGGSVSGSGCSRTATGMVNQVSGDLPSPIGVLDDSVGGIDEGAGMAELVHDLAPGADITFHTAGASQTAFASGIDDLRGCGADVIVDDIIFFAEPMFQDGVVAQAAQAAVDAGVPYFSSAGNQATFGIDDFYVPSGTTGPFGGALHNFGGGDLFASVTLPPFTGVRFVVQWNEPYDFAGGLGTPGPGAVSDYDISILDAPAAGAGILGSSANFQGCGFGVGVQGGDPLEIAAYFNGTASPDTVYLAIEQFCAPIAGGGVDLRVATYGIDTSITGLTFEADYSDMQIYGHAVAAGAVAVAAMDFCEIDLGGGYSGAGGVLDVEGFSSLGGDIPIYFDDTGAAIGGGPTTRAKPEITAPDGTNTTFFGGFHGIGCGEDDAFPNFFGTSAAAPHAAAVAALMLDLQPLLSPADITGILTGTAVDAETAGFDFLSGAGVIDAFDAVSNVPVGAVCDGQAATIVGTPGADVINGTAGPDVIVGLGGADVIRGKGGDDVICAGGGDDRITGGAGDDTIFGQSGNDTSIYATAPAGVTANLGTGRVSGGDGDDSLSSIENLVGSAHDDELVGNAQDNQLIGGKGDDILRGKSGDDLLGGGPGDDRLKGRNGDDTLIGRSGNDTAVYVTAPAGVEVDLGAKTATGGDGNDSVSQIENVIGSANDDILKGNGIDNVLTGGRGDDTLRGRKGNDKLIGGKGSDFANGGSGTDVCRAETELFCEL